MCLQIGRFLDSSSAEKEKRLQDLCTIKELPASHPAVATGHKQERTMERGVFAAQVHQHISPLLSMPDARLSGIDLQSGQCTPTSLMLSILEKLTVPKIMQSPQTDHGTRAHKQPFWC